MCKLFKKETNGLAPICIDEFCHVHRGAFRNQACAQLAVSAIIRGILEGK